LYVPANKEDWVKGASEDYPADGFIFDFEDSIPPNPDDKADARETLVNCQDTLHDMDAVVTVRTNGPQTDYFEADLDAVVGIGVDALMIPDLDSAAEVRHIDSVLTHLEDVNDIEDPLEIIALPEQAYGLNNVDELCAASDRVTAAVGASGENADPQRAVGYEFTREGRERQHLLQQIVMDARSVGVEELVAGVWMDVDDLEGLRQEAEMVRQFGYTSMMVIHPSHVEPVNEIFTPDEERVEHARRLIDAYEDAESEGAIRFEGDMIDTAHVKTARQLVERARAFDMV
jgi:citrate lyase subunit beta/citryl-CoA lyase